MINKKDLELINEFTIKMDKKINKIADQSEDLSDGFKSLTDKEGQTLCLIGYKNSLTMGELANLLGVSYGTPTVTIDRLVEKNFVKRIPDKEDRRKVLVTLTGKGEKIYDEMTEIRLNYLGSIYEKLSEDEVIMLRKILKKITSKI